MVSVLGLLGGCRRFLDSCRRCSLWGEACGHRGRGSCRCCSWGGGAGGGRGRGSCRCGSCGGGGGGRWVGGGARGSAWGVGLACVAVGVVVVAAPGVVGLAVVGSSVVVGAVPPWLARSACAWSTRMLGPVISRITQWWTMRSMAAAVVIGSLKIRSHSLNTRLLVMITERRS